MKAIIIILGLFPWLLTAQQKDKKIFTDFFNPLIGEWQCTVQTRDDSLHNVDWKDVQVRRFQWKLANDFFEEMALFPGKQKGEMVAHGLHLMSFDAETKMFYQSGYWSNKAGRTFDAEGKYSDDGKIIRGVMYLYKPGGVTEKNRLEIKWVNEKQFEYRVFKIDRAGKEYVMEELVYTKK